MLKIYFMSNYNRYRNVPCFIIFIISTFYNDFTIAQVKITKYVSSQEDFPNPERGFYIAAGDKVGELAVNELLKLRTTNSVKNVKANYSTWINLVYRGYLLTDFKKDTISKDFLKKLDQDFTSVRKAGLKVILRFSYTDETHKGDCPDKAICPPYGDASKEIVLKHIVQLKPLLQKNADVIAVMQQGFIGIWGENHYTDYFGDASKNDLGFVPDSSWLDRGEILKALLNALPKDRMVQVRTPQIKQRFLNGPNAPVTTQSNLKNKALSLSDAARIGLHNDCFLASADDYGTYSDYGNSTSKKVEANNILRRYFEAESRFVAVGGETCDDAFSPQNDCAPLGHAEQEMQMMHYSYLNVSYNNLVNNDWEDQGCMMSIKKKLGYRFVLQETVIPENVKLNNVLKISIKVKNEGFAAPYNPRPVQLILQNILSGKVYAVTLKSNVQTWFTGITVIRETLTLPDDVQTGSYNLLLNLPDKYETLTKRPEYSIRLANDNVWDEKTGFNSLNHILKIIN